MEARTRGSSKESEFVQLKLSIRNLQNINNDAPFVSRKYLVDVE